MHADLEGLKQRREKVAEDTTMTLEAAVTAAGPRQGRTCGQIIRGPAVKKLHALVEARPYQPILKAQMPGEFSRHHDAELSPNLIPPL